MILVCGEALMDVVVDESGRRQALPGGGPFNTARALARLGAPAAFLGRISDDPYGQQLASELQQAGVALTWVSRGPEPTTLALASVDAAGVASYTFQFEGTSAPYLTPAMLPRAFEPSVQALHIGTLGLVLEPMATTLIALLRRAHGHQLVMVDPNVRAQVITDRAAYCRRLDESVFPMSAIVKASDQDLAWLYPGLTVEAACNQILRRGAQLVIATLGADGALGVMGRVVVRVSVPRVVVADTIGAGDTFGAAFLAWLHEHQLLRPDLSLSEDDLRAALAFGCEAASWTCTQVGAAVPSRADLRAADAHPAAPDERVRRA